LNDSCVVDENSVDTERLPAREAQQPSIQVPVDAEERAEEAIRLWIASRKTEFPEGTIPRCDLLGVSVVA